MIRLINEENCNNATKYVEQKVEIRMKKMKRRKKILSYSVDWKRGNLSGTLSDGMNDTIFEIKI